MEKEKEKFELGFLGWLCIFFVIFVIVGSLIFGLVYRWYQNHVKG